MKNSKKVMTDYDQRFFDHEETRKNLIEHLEMPTSNVLDFIKEYNEKLSISKELVECLELGYKRLFIDMTHIIYSDLYRCGATVELWSEFKQLQDYIEEKRKLISETLKLNGF